MARGWGGLVELAATPRPAQRRLIELAAVPEAVEDQRLHLAAPPGTGKTLVGLELARQRGLPTLVLVPTAHLVEQWRSEFLSRFRHTARGADLDDLVSTDPARPAMVTITTYQSLAVPARAGTPLDALAHQAWVAELEEMGGLGAEDLERIAQEEPERYRRLLRERVRNLRRSLTRKGALQVTPLLHANSRLALAAIGAAGVGTVVLDECHHLLDHWALVVIELVERLRVKRPEDAMVIGMTATLPDPNTLRQQARYEELLGPVDVEVPVPAVVVEGGLAPFRSLTVEVDLAEHEARLVEEVGEAFRTAALDVSASEAFRTWLVASLVNATAEPDTYSRWLVDDPEFSGAVLRAHRHWSIALPATVPIPGDAFRPLGDDDLVRLLGRYHRDVLAGSVDPTSRAAAKELGRVFAAFGLQLTSKGPRQGRSPLDQLLSRSDAKGAAAAAILEAERAELGDSLRALVAVDFDRAPSPHALLRGVLDKDAGSARRLHRRLVEDPRSSALDPVLVSGRTVRAGNVLADDLEVAVNMALHAAGRDARCRAVPVDDRVQELVGEGPDWSTRHVLPVLTELFSEGRFRCLVATRALVGQGWDCPALNVLVDLTQAASAVASPQLHGRTLRLDPRDEDKVAHNWDVVARAPSLPGGDADQARRHRRHQYLWAIGLDPPPTIGRGASEDVLDLGEVAHAASQRPRVREAWQQVAPPEVGEVVSEVAIDHPAAAHGEQPTWRLRGPAGWVPPFAGAGLGSAAGLAALGAGLPAVAMAGAAAGAGGLAWLVGTMAHREEPRRLLKRLPTGESMTRASEVLDLRRASRLAIFLGRATRDGLVEAGLVPERARSSEVRVQPRNGRIALRFTDPADGPPLTTATHEVLATAVAQVLEGGVALRQRRYALVLNLRPGRRALPCPEVAGVTNSLATSFSEAFGRSLHIEVEAEFLRSPTGRQILLDALAEAPVPFTVASRHVWA